jgi:purine-binding chemotaxis protein CheW
VQLCAFRVGEQEYAVDLMRVEEILRPPPVTPLPRAPAVVEGVAHLRGAVVPVVDLRRCLGAPLPEVAGRRERLLVCLLGRRRVALRVDAVLEVMRVARADLRPAPPLSVEAGTPFVVGVCGSPERLRLLLDVKVLLAAGGTAGGPAGGGGRVAPRGEPGGGWQP